MGKYIIIALIVVCILCCLEWMREIRTFKMTHYHITSKKLNGLKKEKKVILLSDLHNYSYGKQNEKLLQAIKAEGPDYILVSGDMLVGQPGKTAEIAEVFMSKLPEICPVYFSNGNHEQRMKEFPEVYGDVFEKYHKVLETSGVHCLSNDKVEMEWDDVPVCIHGLELQHMTLKNFKKPILESGKMETLLGTVVEDKFNVLIAHNPIFMESYLKWGADLVVSGHVHGGVARIPGIGGVISPQFIPFPKYSGEMRKEGEAFAVVSKGLGMHTIHVRFLNPAEVVVMHINGTED